MKSLIRKAATTFRSVCYFPFMRRKHFIELHEQTWCPAVIRNSVTDYLQHVINANQVYEPIRQRLSNALQLTKTERVVDLCSGGGGPWLSLKKKFEEENLDIEVCLTDYYPNVEAFERHKKELGDGISIYAKSVDALNVPPELKGFRTMFSAFHHFRPEQARAILRDAVNKGCGIGIFEATPRYLSVLVLMLLLPLPVFFITPMIRPFRWSRLLFTYLIPIIPFIIMFDGIISVLRTYTPEEMHKFIKEFEGANYVWEIGEEKGSPASRPYLIGYPKVNETAEH